MLKTIRSHICFIASFKLQLQTGLRKRTKKGGEPITLNEEPPPCLSMKNNSAIDFFMYLSTIWSDLNSGPSSRREGGHYATILIRTNPR